jgi:hypothetical protein
MNPMLPPPLSVIYNLSDLSNAGAELSIAATPEQRARLAEWAEIVSVETFEAHITLKRASSTRFEYFAELSANLVQSCVVTLEPAPAHLLLSITRSLHYTKFPAKADIGPQDLLAGSDEGPEEIEDLRYDLAAPLLEEFSLAIEPYPRAPGVVFEAQPEKDPQESPFAVLKSLKGKG